MPDVCGSCGGCLRAGKTLGPGKRRWSNAGFRQRQSSAEPGGGVLALTVNNTLIATPAIQPGMTNGGLDLPIACPEQAIEVAPAISG